MEETNVLACEFFTSGSRPWLKNVTSHFCPPYNIVFVHCSGARDYFLRETEAIDINRLLFTQSKKSECAIAVIRVLIIGCWSIVILYLKKIK